MHGLMLVFGIALEPHRQTKNTDKVFAAAVVSTAVIQSLVRVDGFFFFTFYAALFPKA